MAKIINPLYSLSAKGKIGYTHSFSSNRTGAFVSATFKRKSYTHYAPSYAQLNVRGLFAIANKFYKSMSNLEIDNIKFRIDFKILTLQQGIIQKYIIEKPTYFGYADFGNNGIGSI